jgi:hypothetical protein
MAGRKRPREKRSWPQSPASAKVQRFFKQVKSRFQMFLGEYPPGAEVYFLQQRN